MKRDELATMGINPNSEEPISKHVLDYIELKSKTGGLHGSPWSEEHKKRVNGYMRWWVKELELNVISDLKLIEVEKLLNSLSLSAKSINNRTATLNNFCEWMVKRGFLNESPLKGLEKRHHKKTQNKRALTFEELDRIFRVAPDDKVLLYKVALLTGLRRSELQRLTYEDLDFKKNVIELSWHKEKNKKGSVFPIPKQVMLELEVGMKAVTDSVFLGNLHQKSADFTKYAKRVAVYLETKEGRVSFHSLRYTFITMVNEIGVDAKTVQTLGRHADANLTFGTYVQTNKDRINSIVEQVFKEIPTGNS